MTVDQTPIVGDLGGKLRLLRRSKSKTLGAVAAAAGCSESMVSKIEKGRVNPSISLLHRLADALDTNISALFDNLASDDVVHRNGTRPRLTAAGPRQGLGHIIEQIIPVHPSVSLQANMHVILPGGSTGEAISHFGDEMGFVLEGEIELHIEDQTWQLREADSFYFKSDRTHTYRNPGAEVARLLLVNTPPSF
ncbi:MAG: XRE family transcriptional regulator [Pseudomonadota bacterium]